MASKRSPRKPRKSWGDLTRKSRDRAARESMRKYGFTRRQTRDRYNRDTYSPFSTVPAKRVPESVRKNPRKYPAYRDSADFELLRELAFANIDSSLVSLTMQYNAFSVRDMIDKHASVDTLHKMADASAEDIMSWARPQSAAEARKLGAVWKAEYGWKDDNGKWHNVFWYH